MICVQITLVVVYKATLTENMSGNKETFTGHRLDIKSEEKTEFKTEQSYIGLEGCEKGV